jgi:hypothetical protein
MMGEITLRVNSLAQRMLFVNNENNALIGRLAAVMLMRYVALLKTGKFVLIAYGARGDITQAR